MAPAARMASVNVAARAQPLFGSTVSSWVFDQYEPVARSDTLLGSISRDTFVVSRLVSRSRIL